MQRVSAENATLLEGRASLEAEKDEAIAAFGEQGDAIETSQRENALLTAEGQHLLFVNTQLTTLTGGQGILELENFRANLEPQFYGFIFICKATLSFGKMMRFVYKTTRR